MKGELKDWFIKNIIKILERLEVGILPQPIKNTEYFYYSTRNRDPYATIYGEWLDYSKSGVNTLQDKKIKEGWYIAYIWHTTIGSEWHTNWIFSRKLNSHVK